MTAVETQARSIFLAALERAPDQWPALLDEACGSNSDLRARVDQLLQAHQAMGSIHRCAPESPGATVDASIPERLGTQIGPYRLMELLGEGGMGLVYVAEQQQPVRRKVALKIIKPGMDSKQVIARFEAERQALALMDHPNIAKVLDAGTTDGRRSGLASSAEEATKRAASSTEGRPYFVMELVKGPPITAYCDQQRLTTQQRLELFVDVCRAVQHAHQKGIIHRDIKPSNVLVAVHDVSPVVKVIDFGIAKATGGQLTDKTLYTQVAQLVGTPLYMSPEQAGCSSLDVDTRSDVYSLGVLLYELLTGTTPFESEALKQAGYDEMRRIIREEEPPKPSARLSTMHQARLSTIAEQRGLEPRRLGEQVRGELDWIAMRAVEKDRNRRYESANAFGADVQRFLNDDPVQACPPSATYRLRKFLRRHKGPVVAAAVVLLALLAGITGTTIGFLRANAALVLVEDQQKRAQGNFRKALDAVDRMLTQVGEVRLADVRQMEEKRQRLLEDALEFYGGFLQEESTDPLVRGETARAYQRLARVYRMLGKLDDAKLQCEKALPIQQGLVTEFSNEPIHVLDLAGTLRLLGELFVESNETRSAERSLQEAVRILKTLTTAHPNDHQFMHALAAAHNSLGDCYRESGRMDAAEEQYANALRLRQELTDKHPDRVEFAEAAAENHEGMGQLYFVTGRRRDADAEFRKAVAIRQELARNDATTQRRERLAKSLNKFGSFCQSCSQWDDAETAYKRALAIIRDLAKDYPRIPDYHDELAKNLWRLAEVCYFARKPTESAHYSKQAQSILESLVRDFPSQARYAHDLGECCEHMAVVLRESGSIKESLTLFDRAIRILNEVLQKRPEHSDAKEQLSITHMARAGTFLALGRELDARNDWERMVELGERQGNIDLRIWRSHLRRPSARPQTAFLARLLASHMSFLAYEKLHGGSVWEGEAPAEPAVLARREPRPPKLTHDQKLIFFASAQTPRYNAGRLKPSRSLSSTAGERRPHRERRAGERHEIHECCVRPRAKRGRCAALFSGACRRAPPGGVCHRYGNRLVAAL